MTYVRLTIDAVISGAASAIDLAPPAPAIPGREAAIAGYWSATGAFMWEAVDVCRPLYEMQQPLFDADALPVVKR
jgi:hypothetical protein